MNDREKQLLQEVFEVTRKFQYKRVSDEPNSFKIAKFLNFQAIDPEDQNSNSVLFNSIDECVKVISLSLKPDQIDKFTKTITEQQSQYDSDKVRLLISEE